MDNKTVEQKGSRLSGLRSALGRVFNRRGGEEVVNRSEVEGSNFVGRIVGKLKGNNSRESSKPLEMVYQSEIIDSKEYKELCEQITKLLRAMQNSKNEVARDMFKALSSQDLFTRKKPENAEELLNYLIEIKALFYGERSVMYQILEQIDYDRESNSDIANINPDKIEYNLSNVITLLNVKVAEKKLTIETDYDWFGDHEDPDIDQRVASENMSWLQNAAKQSEQPVISATPLYSHLDETQEYGGEEETQLRRMVERNSKEAEEFINGEMKSNPLKYFELSQSVRREVITRIKDKLLILRESIGTEIDENLLIELLSFDFAYGLIELSTDHSLLNYLFSSIEHSKLYSQLLHTFGVYEVAIKNYILYLKTKGQLEEYKSFLEQEQLYYQRLISKHKEVIENIDNEAISSIESVAPEPEPIPINQKAVDIERRRVKKLEERRDRTLRNLVRKFDEYLEQSLSDYESIVPRYLRGAESNAILVESKLRSVVKYEFDEVNLNLNFIELSKLLAPGVDEIEFISKFFNFLKSVQHLIPSGSRLGVFSVDLDVQKTNNLLRLEEGYERFYANLSKIDEKSIAEWTNGIDVDIPEEKDKALEFLRETLKKVGRSISVMAEALKNKLKVQEETDLTPSDAMIQDIPSIKETLRLIQESRGNPEARRRVKHLTDSDLESKELQKFKPKYHSYYKLYNGGSQLPTGVKVFSTGGSLGAYYQYFGNAPLYSGLTKRELSYFQTPIIKELIGRVKPEFVKRIVESQDDQVIIQILDDLEAPSTKAETFEDFLNKSISDINKKFENTEKLDDQELKVVKFIVSQFEIQDTEQNINRGMLYDPKPVLAEVTNTDSSQPAEESQLEEEDLPELESLTNELDDQPHTNTPRKPVKDVINPLDIHGPKNEKFVLDESLVYPVEVNESYESTPYDNLAIDLLTELDMFIASIKDRTQKNRLNEKKETIKKEIDKLLEVQGEITPVKIKIKFNYLLGILRDLGLPEQGLSTLRSKLSAL